MSEGLTFEALAALSDEERRALRMGEEPTPAEAPEPAEAPDGTPEAPEEVLAPDAVGQVQDQDQNPLMAYIQQIHGQMQQMQAQNEAMANYLASLGQQGQQQMPEEQEPPDALMDPDGAVAWHVQQAIKPYQEQVNLLLQERQQHQAALWQQQQQQRYAQAAQQFGQDVVGMIPALDEAAPHLRDLDPVVKGFILRGHQASQAGWLESQVQQKAEELAARRVAEILGKNAPPGVKPSDLPTTLGQAIRGQDPMAGMDASAITMNNLSKLNEQQRLQLRMSLG